MNQLARSPKQMGAIIQAARHQRGMNQSQLADLAGMRQETVSSIEGGLLGAKLSSIFDILAALDLEITVQARSRSSAADIQAIF